jgi:ATP adenylyltransferase
MKQLWAPWRLAFIEHSNDGSRCIFCEKPALKQDRRAYILWRSRHAYVMLNIYPYNNGHLLIAPYQHIAAIEDLPLSVVLDMMRLVQRAIKAIRLAYAPEGFNLGVNQGRVAGAGIEHHVHLHIVPRWEADTNFMPLLGETRVLPHHLKASYARLKAAFSKVDAPAPPAHTNARSNGSRKRSRAPRASRRAP